MPQWAARPALQTATCYISERRQEKRPAAELLANACGDGSNWCATHAVYEGAWIWISNQLTRLPASHLRLSVSERACLLVLQEGLDKLRVAGEVTSVPRASSAAVCARDLPCGCVRKLPQLLHHTPPQRGSSPRFHALPAACPLPFLLNARKQHARGQQKELRSLYASCTVAGRSHVMSGPDVAQGLCPRGGSQSWRGAARWATSDAAPRGTTWSPSCSEACLPRSAPLEIWGSKVRLQSSGRLTGQRSCCARLGWRLGSVADGQLPCEIPWMNARVWLLHLA